MGQGLDVHAFSADGGRPLVLGGVAIPGGPGLEGHSDADVVLHAVVDALLGAAALGDLGTVFGTDDPAHAGAASAVFVTEALRLALAGGWAVGNLDCTAGRAAAASCAPPRGDHRRGRRAARRPARCRERQGDHD